MKLNEIFDATQRVVPYHKFAFRRKQLPKLLGKAFDPLLTEVENMRNAGFYRIWNCGLLRFIRTSQQLV
jgi:hypothetical protein